MKVTVVAEQLRRSVPGGIGTYVHGLITGLARIDSDADVTLYGSRPRRRPDPLTSFGFPVVTAAIPGPLLTRAWDKGVAPRLPAADVVHATSLATPPPGPAPLTVMVHDTAWRTVPEAYPPHGRRWHQQALERALHRAAAFVVPSNATADDLLAAGADAGKVVVIPEGCDHLPPADMDATVDVLQRHGVIGPFLLTVSTVEPRKNLPRLIEAYQVARPELDSEMPLVVVGPQGWGPELRPADGVVLLGRVEPDVLAGLYAAARCVAYVPLREGFGLPAVEAMAAGAPVVASPMPSTGGAALEVDPLDVDAIAQGLVTAGTDGDERAHLIAVGRARADSLKWTDVARAHVELWSGMACG